MLREVPQSHVLKSHYVHIIQTRVQAVQGVSNVALGIQLGIHEKVWILFRQSISFADLNVINLQLNIINIIDCSKDYPSVLLSYLLYMRYARAH